MSICLGPLNLVPRRPQSTSTPWRPAMPIPGTGTKRCRMKAQSAETHFTFSAGWVNLAELLGLVIAQAPTVPMLHVLTYRPEFSPPWPPRSHMTPLVLNRLERPQVEALIAQRAGGKTLPAEVVQYIVAKTDGVPLYVEELTKMLLASPLLREEADQYVLTGPLHTVAIPDTLQDALMARLDQLNRAKEVAQLGAVLGREFPYELLQAIAPQDEETLQAGAGPIGAPPHPFPPGGPPPAPDIF